MTMGLNTFNAYDLLKNISEKDLKDILKYFGEEKFFSRFLRSIINNRDKKIYFQVKNYQISLIK